MRDARPVDKAAVISRPRSIGARSKAWQRQFAECVILPFLGASLPWPLAWRILQWLANGGRFFGVETARAQLVAVREGFAGDADAWAAWHRLTRIVDQVDPALSWLRGDRWMDRHLIVDGDPLPAGPCIFVGFHYGTGFWSLRHLKRNGHRVAFISAPVDADQCPGQPLRLAFMRWRMKRVEEAGGAPVIYVGGGRDRIQAALRGGISVLGMVDVPQPSSSRVAVEFLGGKAWFPDGLLRVAATENVPLFAYLARLDPQTGARQLQLTRLPAKREQALRALAAMLESAVCNESAAWHLWADWPLFVKGRSAH